jgi:hypothetical protein
MLFLILCVPCYSSFDISFLIITNLTLFSSFHLCPKSSEFGWFYFPFYYLFIIYPKRLGVTERESLLSVSIKWMKICENVTKNPPQWSGFLVKHGRGTRT